MHPLRLYSTTSLSLAEVTTWRSADEGMNRVLKTRNLALILVLLIAAVIFASSNDPVLAQSPCLAQVGYPTISTSQYYGANIGMTVPVYATCSFYSGQLYAVGSAYDTVLNSNLGSVSTPLYTASIGSFNGQLVFNLPVAAQGHTVQFTISIYSSAYGYNGSPLATTYQAVTVNGGYPYYQNSYAYCQSGGYSYGNSCYSPGYGYNNYYAYCPPGYSYNGAGCSYPGSYYTMYYSHGNYYKHWYYHHNR